MSKVRAFRGAANRGPVDDVPPTGRLVTFSLQHLLTFYATIIVFPKILAEGVGLSPQDERLLLGAAIFAGGVATLIQTVGFWKVGIRYPLILGASAVAFGPTIVIASGLGGRDGLAAVFTATIIAGVILFFAAPLYGYLIRFFPPVVMGSVILLVGLTVLPVGANLAGGGDEKAGTADFGDVESLTISGVTVLTIIVLHGLARGMIKNLAILIGLIAGTVVGIAFGAVDFSVLSEAQWFAIVQPFHFGGPVFNMSAIITMTIVMIIVAVESTASFFAAGNIIGHDTKESDVVRGVRAEGLGTVAGGLFNTLAPTTFNGNVGLLRTSGIRSRWVCALVGVLMIVLSCFPKVSAVAGLIPAPAVGAALLILFGIIATVGIKILSTVDLNADRNLIVVAASIGVGTVAIATPDYFQHLPEQLQTVLGSGIVCGALVALILNAALNRRHSQAAARDAEVR